MPKPPFRSSPIRFRSKSKKPKTATRSFNHNNGTGRHAQSLKEISPQFLSSQKHNSFNFHNLAPYADSTNKLRGTCRPDDEKDNRELPFARTNKLCSASGSRMPIKAHALPELPRPDPAEKTADLVQSTMPSSSTDGPPPYV